MITIPLYFASVQSAPIYGEETNLPQPGLQIQKWIDTNETKLGVWFTVHVNITNPSNYTIKNPEITEPRFRGNIFADDRDTNPKSDYLKYDYTTIKPNAHPIYYEYNLRPNKTGRFVLEPTEIVFYDINGSEYYARSNHIDFLVYEDTPPSILTQSYVNKRWNKWGDLALMCIGVILMLICLFFIQKKLSFEKSKSKDDPKSQNSKD